MYNKTNLCVRWHTTDYQLSASEAGSVHSNLGATTIVTMILPSSVSQGIIFTFVLEVAGGIGNDYFRINPGSATIRDLSNPGLVSGKYITADASGEAISFISDSNGDWCTISKNGTWTMES